MRDDARVSIELLSDSIDLDGIRSVLAETGVQYAVVFGSFATGSETSASDLDVCVRFADECSRHGRFRQRNRIDSQLQSYAEPFVDVSDLEALPDAVALNALQHGVILCGDPKLKTADERRLERCLEAASEEREQQRREFIDRLAEGNI